MFHVPAPRSQRGPIGLPDKSAPSAALGAIENVAIACADRLTASGLRPDHVTYFSVAPAAISLVCVARGEFLAGVAFMVLSGVCDLLDGKMARRSGQMTLFGALLDSTLDRFADAAPLLGLVYFWAGYPTAALVAASAVFAGFAVSYVRARAEGLQIALPWLWMRRTERLILTGVGLLLGNAPLSAIDAPAPWTLLLVAGVGLASLAATIHALIVAAQLTRGSRPTESPPR